MPTGAAVRAPATLPHLPKSTTHVVMAKQNRYSPNAHFFSRPEEEQGAAGRRVVESGMESHEDT